MINHLCRLIAFLWLSFAAISVAAEETTFLLKGQERDTFTARADVASSARADAEQLVTVAKTNYGLVLDYSETSIVQLQILAENLRGTWRPWRDFAAWEPERREWSQRVGAYYGEILVRNRGGVWGRTTFLGGSERAIGFPKSRAVSFPMDRMDKALQFGDTTICGWYMISSRHDGKGIPKEIEACKAKGWQKSEAELEWRRKRQAAIDNFNAEELKARQQSRTAREIAEGISRHNWKIGRIFRRHGVRKNGKVIVSLTVLPNGDVSKIHLVSSDFQNPSLEREIIALMRAVRFQARDVPSFTHQEYAIVWQVNP